MSAPLSAHAVRKFFARNPRFGSYSATRAMLQFNDWGWNLDDDPRFVQVCTDAADPERHTHRVSEAACSCPARKKCAHVIAVETHGGVEALRRRIEHGLIRIAGEEL